MPAPVFTDWDGRPAVLVSNDEAFAVLRGSWTKVDELDVFSSGRVMSEGRFRAAFAEELASAGDLPSASSQAGSTLARAAP